MDPLVFLPGFAFGLAAAFLVGLLSVDTVGGAKPGASNRLMGAGIVIVGFGALDLYQSVVTGDGRAQWPFALGYALGAAALLGLIRWVKTHPDSRPRLFMNASVAGMAVSAAAGSGSLVLVFVL